MKISGLDLIFGNVAGFSGVIEKNRTNSEKDSRSHEPRFEPGASQHYIYKHYTKEKY
jgi:hypothetical protein